MSQSTLQTTTSRRMVLQTPVMEVISRNVTAGIRRSARCLQFFHEATLGIN